MKFSRTTTNVGVGWSELVAGRSWREKWGWIRTRGETKTPMERMSSPFFLSQAYSSQYLETYTGHYMAVYAVQWNLFHPSVFLSARWVRVWCCGCGYIGHDRVCQCITVHGVCIVVK